MEKIVRENAFEKKKKKLGLKLNPRLALIGLRTAGSRGPFLENPGNFLRARNQIFKSKYKE